MTTKTIWAAAAVSVLWLAGCECRKTAKTPVRAPAAASHPAGRKAADIRPAPWTLLPEDTLAVVRVPKVEVVLGHLRGGRMGRAGRLGLNALSAAGPGEGAWGSGATALGKIRGFLGRYCAKGECALACLRMDAQTGYWPVPQAVFVADTGADPSQALQELKRMLTGLKGKSERFSFSAGSQKGAKYEKFGDAQVQIAFGNVKGLLVVASSEKAYQELLGTAPPLSAHAPFQAAEAKIENCDVFAYVNVTALRDACGAYQPAVRTHRAVRALGIAGLSGAAYGLSWDESGMREKAFLYCPTGREGIFRWIEGKQDAAAVKDLALVPADALWVGSARVDFGNAWNQIVTTIQAAGPKDWQKQGPAEIKNFERIFGMPLEQILGSLDGQVVMYGQGFRMPSLAGGLLHSDFDDDAVYLVGLRDEETCRKAVDHLISWTRSVGAYVSQAQVGPHMMHSWPHGRNKEGSSEISFSCAVAQGRLAFSRSPLELKRALARISIGSAQPSVAESEGFRRATGALQTRGNCMSYYNLSRMYEELLPVAEMALAMSGGVGARLLQELPAAGSPENRPAGGWAVSASHEEKGMFLESSGPAPVLGASGACVVALPWVAARSTRKQ